MNGCPQSWVQVSQPSLSSRGKLSQESGGRENRWGEEAEILLSNQIYKNNFGRSHNVGLALFCQARRELRGPSVWGLGNSLKRWWPSYTWSKRTLWAVVWLWDSGTSYPEGQKGHGEQDLRKSLSVHSMKTARARGPKFKSRPHHIWCDLENITWHLWPSVSGS